MELLRSWPSDSGLLQRKVMTMKCLRILGTTLLLVTASNAMAASPYSCTFIHDGKWKQEMVQADSETHARQVIIHKYGFFNVDRVQCARA